MEIKDYLKVLGKRAWLLVMIPAVAGVVAGLIAVRQPQAFRTTATLQLPHDKKASPAEVAQLVADFRATIRQPDHTERGVRGHRRAGQAHQADQDHPGGRLEPAHPGHPGQEAQPDRLQGGDPGSDGRRARLPGSA